MPTVAAALAAALAVGGCSFAYQLDSMFGTKRKGDAAAEHTSSIRPRAQAATTPAALPPDADLAIARAAAVDALSRDSKSASIPWENPKTGARGTITPLENAYTVDGFPCRDFLASYVRAEKETWMQGEACRVHKGQWEVRALKPWQRT